MFVLERSKSLWKVYCSNIEKNFYSRLYSNSKIIPGTRRRLQLVEDEQELDPENIDFEANFESLHRSHKEHIIEIGAQKDKLKYNIVKQKYFNNKYPNFLTWHDKEQIRLLHSQDPEEWDVDKLSEGFPALPEIITKIVKSTWRKKSLAKIRSHDAAVKENWKKFKNEEFEDLPSSLVKHLKKFSARDFNFHHYENFKSNNKTEFNSTNKITEFSEIINSYEKFKKNNLHGDESNRIEANSNNNYSEHKTNDDKDKYMNGTIKNKLELNSRIVEVNSNDSLNKYRNNDEEDTYVIGTIKNKHPVTLDFLKNKLEKDLEHGVQVSYTDIQIVESSDTNEISEKKIQTSSSSDQLTSVKYNRGSIAEMDDKNAMAYAHLVYPEKIYIPRTILKKGHTYKLNDCYYDSDGQFLYRVPGMY